MIPICRTCRFNVSISSSGWSHVRHAVFNRIVVHGGRRCGRGVMNVGRDRARYIRYAQSAAQSANVAQI